MRRSRRRWLWTGSVRGGRFRPACFHFTWSRSIGIAACQTRFRPFMDAPHKRPPRIIGKLIVNQLEPGPVDAFQHQLPVRARAVATVEQLDQSGPDTRRTVLGIGWRTGRRAR